MSLDPRRPESFIRRLAHRSVCIGGALLVACTALLPDTLGFSAAELETRLAERMPFRRQLLGLFELELAHPKIALDANEQRITARFTLNVRTTLGSRIYPGAIHFSGTPRYDAPTRSVMFDQARVDALELEGISRAVRDQLNEIASLVAKDVLDRRPLYTLKPDQLRWAGVTLTPKGVRIVADRLLIDLERGDRR